MRPPATEVPVLLPLYARPSWDPAAWRAAELAGPGLTVVVRCDGYDPGAAAWIARLAAAGVVVLGHVDLSFATRPLADLLSDLSRWAAGPATGVFLDQAPTSPFSIGPVAMAVRKARRAGLVRVVINPGTPTDPLYRELAATVCTFEGPWPDYQRWNGEGSHPGDGHLVHSVPPDSVPAAWEEVRTRRAGFGLVTDGAPPQPYESAPAWLAGVTASLDHRVTA